MAKTSTSRDALKYLEELRFIKTKEEHPDFPYPVKKKYKDKSSTELENAIVDYITLSGGWATKIQVEGRYNVKQGFRIPSRVKTGTSDVIACWKGMFLAIEVKIGYDKQSESQIEVQREIERPSCSGKYFIAKDFDTFFKWINGL